MLCNGNVSWRCGHLSVVCWVQHGRPVPGTWRPSGLTLCLCLRVCWQEFYHSNGPLEADSAAGSDALVAPTSPTTAAPLRSAPGRDDDESDTTEDDPGTSHLLPWYNRHITHLWIWLFHVRYVTKKSQRPKPPNNSSRVRPKRSQPRYESDSKQDGPGMSLISDSDWDWGAVHTSAIQYGVVRKRAISYRLGNLATFSRKWNIVRCGSVVQTRAISGGAACNRPGSIPQTSISLFALMSSSTGPV